MPRPRVLRPVMAEVPLPVEDAVFALLEKDFDVGGRVRRGDFITQLWVLVGYPRGSAAFWTLKVEVFDMEKGDALDDALYDAMVQEIAALKAVLKARNA